MPQPLLLAVVGMAAMTVATWLAAWLHEAWQRQSHPRWHGLLGALRSGRRKYAAYSVHLGFVCVAIGVAGSSLGTQRNRVVLEDELASGAGAYPLLVFFSDQRQLPDK